MFSLIRKTKSDLYTPAAILILAKHFHLKPEEIKEAPLLMDMTEGVDLLLPDLTRISLRIRYDTKYYGSFGFRHQRNATCETEWEKIISRKSPRNYLYCFGAPDGTILHWWLLDMAAIWKAEEENWMCSLTPDDQPFFGDGMTIIDGSGFLSRPHFVIASSEKPFKSRDDICEECRRRAWERMVEELTSRN